MKMLIVLKMCKNGHKVQFLLFVFGMLAVDLLNIEFFFFLRRETKTES